MQTRAQKKCARKKSARWRLRGVPPAAQGKKTVAPTSKRL